MTTPVSGFANENSTTRGNLSITGTFLLLETSPGDEDKTESGAELACLYLIAVATSLLNALLLYILVRKLSDKVYSNGLFVSLTLSDLVVGLGALPFEIINYSSSHVYAASYQLDLLHNIIDFSQTSISLNSVLALTWHRYRIVTRPFKASEQMTRLRLALIAGIWLGVYLVWTVHFLANPGSMDHASGDGGETGPDPAASYVKLALIVLTYIVPVALIVGLALRIIKLLRDKMRIGSELTDPHRLRRKRLFLFAITATIALLRERRRRLSQRFSVSQQSGSSTTTPPTTTMDTSPCVRDHGSSQHQHSRARLLHGKKELRAIVCLSLITSTVFFSQIVYMVTFPLKDLGLLGAEYEGLSSAATIVSYLNSLVDPLIVFACHETVRHELVLLVGRLRGLARKVRRSCRCPRFF